MLPFISLDDEEFKPVFDVIAEKLQHKYLYFNQNIRLVMLCGKALQSDTRNQLPSNNNRFLAGLLGKIKRLINGNVEPESNRSKIIEYARSSHAKHRYLLAENIFHEDFVAIGLNLLRGESSLAGMVDCILLFVESMGTAAELGAFSIKKHLCDKLLVINDDRFEKSKSFISQGPLMLVNQKSQYKPVIYCDINQVETRLDDIIKIIDENPEKPTRFSLPVKAYSKLSPKLWMFIICYIIYIFQPIDSQSIKAVLVRIVGPIKQGDLFAFLRIAMDAGLIESRRHVTQNLFYFVDAQGADELITGITSDDISVIRLHMRDVLADKHPQFYELWNRG